MCRLINICIEKEHMLEGNRVIVQAHMETMHKSAFCFCFPSLNNDKSEVQSDTAMPRDVSIDTRDLSATCARSMDPGPRACLELC